MPETIVIDEIGTELEAHAAGTIAQRGVQLVATAHGMSVENLIKNPSLQMLGGGIQVGILSIFFNYSSECEIHDCPFQTLFVIIKEEIHYFYHISIECYCNRGSVLILVVLFSLMAPFFDWLLDYFVVTVSAN